MTMLDDPSDGRAESSAPQAAKPAGAKPVGAKPAGELLKRRKKKRVPLPTDAVGASAPLGGPAGAPPRDHPSPSLVSLHDQRIEHYERQGLAEPDPLLACLAPLAGSLMRQQAFLDRAIDATLAQATATLHNIQVLCEPLEQAAKQRRDLVRLVVLGLKLRQEAQGAQPAPPPPAAAPRLALERRGATDTPVLASLDEPADRPPADRPPGGPPA